MQTPTAPNAATVCTLETDYGARYEIKQACAEPRRYVTYVTHALGTELLHRDARTLSECLGLIGLCVENAIHTADAVKVSLARRAADDDETHWRVHTQMMNNLRTESHEN